VGFVSPESRTAEPRDRIRVFGHWVAGVSDDVPILEIDAIDRRFDWPAAVRVRLTLRSGERIDCEIDPRHTTAAARIEVGMAFRIALRLAADIQAAVMAVEIDLGKEILRILP
jgi:hypothetical protein